MTDWMKIEAKVIEWFDRHGSFVIDRTHGDIFVIGYIEDEGEDEYEIEINLTDLAKHLSDNEGVAK